MSSSKTQADVITLQVLTTSGNYPPGGFESFNDHERLSAVLQQAAAHLKLHNTDTWVAKLGDRQLDPTRSLEDNAIPSGSQIFWGPVERGGGRSNVAGIE